MFPFPSKKVRLQSALSQEALLEQLRVITDEKKTGFFPLLFQRNKKNFIGKISEKAFELDYISYRRFVPRIKGSIELASGVSFIDLHMSSHPFFIIFMLIYFLLVGLFGLITLLSHFSQQAEADFGTFIPLLMLVGGLATLFLAFKIYNGQALKELKASLKASEIKISLN